MMFYIGAIFISRGRYTFPQMLQVFSLITFTVSFAAQTMSYGKLCFRCSSSLAKIRAQYLP